MNSPKALCDIVEFQEAHATLPFVVALQQERTFQGRYRRADQINPDDAPLDFVGAETSQLMAQKIAPPPLNYDYWAAYPAASSLICL